MLSLNIQGDSVYFRDIKLEHLPQILNWYNKIDDFKFATGIDQPMTIRDANSEICRSIYLYK